MSNPRTEKNLRVEGSFNKNLARITVVLAVAFVVFVLTFRPVSDTDTWFHLELGKWITANHALPHIDPFSYTAGDTPYVPSGWLTAWLMWKLDLLYPESSLGPILMVTLLIAIASFIIMARAWRQSTVVSTGILLMAGLTMGVLRFSPRPDVWSILGLVCLLAILSTSWCRPPSADQNEMPGSKRLWFLVPLIVIWANLHAGVLIALPFLGIYGVWLIIRYAKSRDLAWIGRLLPVAVASVAWLANPYGIGIALLAVRIARIPEVSWVMEWMPFFTSRFALAWPVYVCGALLLLAIVFCIIRGRRQIHPLEIIWLAMLVSLALWQRRQVSLLALGCPLLLARNLRPMEEWFRRSQIMRSMLLPIGAAVAIAAVQISGANGNGGGKPGFGRMCSVLPCITGDFLAANPPPAPIFNSYNMGGYLLHVLYPKTKVFIDGRLDVYPSQVWLDMLAVEENRLPVDELVSRYGIKTFVISIGDSFGDPMHLASRLAARKDYALVHLDDYAAVFVRRTVESAAWIDRFEFKHVTPWNLHAMDQALASTQGRDQVIAEVGRLLRQSGGAANANAVAAYVAWKAGDPQTAQEQLSAARQRQSEGRLLGIVQNIVR